MDSDISYDQLKSKMIQLVHTRTNGVAPMYALGQGESDHECEEEPPETVETDLGVYSLVRKRQ